MPVRSHPPLRSLAAAGALLFAGLLGAAREAGAQLNGNGYLFGRPTGTFTLRAGYDRPNAQGSVYDEFADRLTLGRGSYGGGAVNAELAFTVADRIDLAIGGGYARSERDSEFREFVNQDDSPIRQTTSLRRLPLTAGAKFYLTPRGRSIGRLAWIPSRFSPYVGGGGGAVYYRLQQNGSFVDANTSAIFPATLRSTGWAASAYGAAGAEIGLSTRFVLSTELRYTAARGALRGDFVDFDRISLSGIGLTAGAGIRF